MSLRTSFAVVLAALPCAALRSQTSIRWTPSLAEARTLAATEQRVLLLAFHMAGERANELLVADHYRDPLLARLSQHTVNVFCTTATVPCVPGVTVAQQQAAEREARLQVLKIGPGEDVIAPQHVFVGPDGTILSSVPYLVTKGELEWVWVDAIRRVDPGFVWQLGPGARAPARLAFGSVERGNNTPPPTDQQVDEALKELKKSRGGILRNLQQVELLMRSDRADAIAFVDTTLKTVTGQPLATALDTIGVVSPPVWYGVLAARLEDRDETVRVAAAGGLERLAEPKSAAPLLKAYRAEKADRVRGRLLRALAAAAPAGKETIAQIEKVLTKEPSTDVRAHAVLALGRLEDRERVHAGLEHALRDGSAKVRATAACVLAERRETAFADRLAAAAAQEAEPDTKAWLEAALEVVRGGDGKAFAQFRERVLGEAPVRPGLSGLGGGGRRGG